MWHLTTDITSDKAQSGDENNTVRWKWEFFCKESTTEDWVAEWE